MAATLGKNSPFMLFLWMVACLCLCPASISARNLRLSKHPIHSNSDESLSFLVVGDWEWKGTYNQLQVASQVKRGDAEVQLSPLLKKIDPRWHCLRNFILTRSGLDLALNKSEAQWKIVVGHHVIRSIGHHGDPGNCSANSVNS
ncbi:hypothetical protein LguiB_007480 [Lonicera macranthoides]